MTTPARACGGRHGADFGFQYFRRQPGFEHVTYDQRLRPCSGDGQVVHGSVHRQLSDGASGKTQRPDHEAVGGHRDTGSVDVHVGRVAQRRGNRSEKNGRE